MFKLNFEIPKSESQIDLKSKIYLMGSCFSDDIGKKLLEDKFNVLSNPFGTIYNPISIFKLLRSDIDPTNTIESYGVFYHWDCNGIVSDLSASGAIKKIKSALSLSSDFLKESNYLIITPGTAWVYRNIETNEIVANCHKVPASSFKKELLSPTQIRSEFAKLAAHLNSINPSLQIILTLSPVRHIRDGLVENNRSKSILTQAIHDLVEEYENVSYFPSYEIVIDELRDYRFFENDLIHPSKDAIHYIWGRFSETYFNEPTLAFLEVWSKLKSALYHKPFHPNSASHQTFIKETLKKLNQLNNTVDLSVEIEAMKAQLI